MRKHVGRKKMNDKSGITTCFGDLFIEWKNNASSGRAKLFGIKTFFPSVEAEAIMIC